MFTFAYSIMFIANQINPYIALILLAILMAGAANRMNVLPKI